MAKITSLSNVVVNAQADALAAKADGGFIEIYDGEMPETPDEPLRGQRLAVTLALSSPAFMRASDGAIIANSISPGDAVASVNPVTWARVRSKDGSPLMDISVGTRDAVLVLPSVNIPAGVTVTCSFFQHTVVKA